MGSGNSHLNPSEIRIDDRLSRNSTDENINPDENKKLQECSILDRPHSRIILSINNDKTIRISAGKSCATQTTDETESEEDRGLKVIEQQIENSCAPIETKANQEIQTDLLEPSDDETKLIKDVEEALLYTETDNEARYSTDIGFRTDEDTENEPTELRASRDEHPVDSAITLHETPKEAKVEEAQGTYSQGEDGSNIIHDDINENYQPRPFDAVILEKYGKYKIRMSCDQKNCIASSTAFLETGDAVIIDRSNQSIKFVDRKFQFISGYKLSAKPWAVCTRGKDVYVTMGNTQIQHLVVADMIIEPFEAFEVKGRCLGVCVFDAHLAVGLQIGEISLLDFKGISKGSIKLPLINKKSCNPWHLCSTVENNILVTDSDAGAVYCLNRKSELVFQYQGVDTPRGTSLDNAGNIVVIGRDKQSGAVVTLIHRDVELQSMLHIEQNCKTNIESRTLIKWEELEFVPYSVCYRKDGIIVFGGIQETLKIMKLR